MDAAEETGRNPVSKHQVRLMIYCVFDTENLIVYNRVQ